jgi:L-ascorbate metabolism protein UlaG (beta-lactamase superfamily)
MLLIKYRHACVRLEDGDARLLIDPGVWTEPEAFDGVGDVLVTHEHFDHLDADLLAKAFEANPALRVHTVADVAAQLSRFGEAVRTVAVGDVFTAGSFTVEVVGGAHAEIYDGLPGCANVGYLVNDEVYHPGDSYFVPHQNVGTLLVPISGPWTKLGEGLDFVRAVGPRRAVPIHDAMLNDIGQGGTDRWMQMKADTDYVRVPDGQALDLA